VKADTAWRVMYFMANAVNYASDIERGKKTSWEPLAS
jgi:hypothetical protein